MIDDDVPAGSSLIEPWFDNGSDVLQSARDDSPPPGRGCSLPARPALDYADAAPDPGGDDL